MAVYEIFALKYAGPLTGSGALLMWFKDWEEIVERNYYFWCLKGEGETVVVDAGVSPDLAREKDLNGYVSPAEMLSRIGVRAEEVRHVEIGTRWFRHCCEEKGVDPETTFLDLLERYYGKLPEGPFNLDARYAAGFTHSEMDAISKANG